MAGIAATVALLSGWRAPALAAQETARCALDIALGVGVPLNDPPEGTGHTSGLETSGGGRLGVACNATPSLRLGAELEAYSFKQLLLGHLAGTVGVELPLSGAARARWLGLTGKLGLARSAEIGSRPLILRFGRHLKLNSLGVAAAGAVRHGVPLGARSAVIVEVSLHASFLPTKREPGGAGDRLTTVVTVPISLGFRIGV